MKFTNEFLSEIRARVPVSQVVGARVKLKKDGREWRGLSPFNEERTPSFFVNDQKAILLRFFVGQKRRHLHLSGRSRGPQLSRGGRAAGRHGGPRMPRATPKARRATSKRATPHEVAGARRAKSFEATLHDPVGAKARGYLADRRLDPPTQRAFGLGYAAPDRFALRDALAARGVDAAAHDRGGVC